MSNTSYIWKPTREELEKAVTDSISIAGALRCLKLPLTHRYYKRLKDKCQELNIDTAHFKGQAWVTPENNPKLKPIQYFFDKKQFSSSTHRLKLRLIKEGYFIHQCNCCKIIDWLGQPTPLELNHIDGNRTNNNLSNFELLCPNCHAQTHTYRAKNMKKYKEKLVR